MRKPLWYLGACAVASAVLVLALTLRRDGTKALSSNPATAVHDTPLNETAIGAALNRGGMIRLPAGTVEITRPLRVTKSGTKLIGSGRDATVLRMAFGR